MVFCCIPNCHNRPEKEECKEMHFYKIPAHTSKVPSEQKRRKDWIKAIKRLDWEKNKEKWPDTRIDKQHVCSSHFVSGERSTLVTDVDWVPTVFSHKASKPKSALQKKRKNADERKNQVEKRSAKKIRLSVPRKKEEGNSSRGHEASDEVCANANDAAVNESVEDPAVQNMSPSLDSEIDMVIDVGCYTCMSKNQEIQSLKAENKDLKVKLQQYHEELINRNKEIYDLRKVKHTGRKAGFSFSDVQNSEKKLNFFTGLKHIVFTWILSKVIEGGTKLYHSRLTACDHLLIVLMKLRLGLYSEDISYRFNVDSPTISKNFCGWIKPMAVALKNAIVWPEGPIIRQNLPSCFKKQKYRDCVCIIDCSEIFIERPSNLTARAQTWSTYKHNNTAKYLIGISPSGSIMFLSSGWGGRVWDKQITIDSGFLDYVSNGDCILADRGFNIKEEVAAVGGTLRIPHFTKGKKQLPGEEVDHDRKLSNVRIHVERVIGRMKTFCYIQQTVPLLQVPILDECMIVISSIVNLNQSVVNE